MFPRLQSLGIAILYHMDLIPHYHSSRIVDDNNTGMGTLNMPMKVKAEEALAFDVHGGGKYEDGDNNNNNNNNDNVSLDALGQDFTYGLPKRLPGDCKTI
ncbi:unnamed protein product [Cylindrotheca closterium]|uniref:Uncharacterized protein n=1 Tax=Cylindrotheca closterium TaxID=2856 RepID=A0AAD2G1D2_9STRA|nr:unnamed protein product [Cylindrotheca closterium]